MPTNGVPSLRHASGRALSVLLDGYNLALDRGTGVATYGRNLIGALQTLGCDVGIVYGSAISSRDDDLLKEIKFFDVRPERGGHVARLLRPFDGMFSFGRREVVRVPMTGAVMTREFGSRLPSCDRLFNVYKLYSRATLRHDFFGRRFELRMSDTPDVMHWTYPLPIRLEGAKNIYTLHDLVPLRLPYTTLDRKARYLALARWIARTADHIVTVSEASRRDIIELLGVPPDRVTNTYQAVAMPTGAIERTDDDVAAEIEGVFGLGARDYFLFFGAIEPKKNVRRLVEAYLGSGIARPLVIVGADAWKTGNELRLIDALPGVDRHVMQIDYLPQALLVSLIRMARAVVFPSLYEGFGLPVLEAMTLGTPVLTSNAGSIPEVAGDAALTVDPYDVRAIMRGLQMLDQNDMLCVELSARGASQAERFSGEIYRARVAEVYRRVTAGA